VITKFADAIERLSNLGGIPVMIVADAFYSVRGLISRLKKNGHVLVSRVAKNTVAHRIVSPNEKRSRGRPKIKGIKVKLDSLFEKFQDTATDYNDGKYLSVNLYWPSAQAVVRFVLVENTKGRAIYMSTKKDLDPLTIIQLYQARWSIETSFKSAVHTIGTYAYHFWMKAMKPIRRGQTKQYTHKETPEYRESIDKKMQAIHTYISLATISHGLMIHLGINKTSKVWKSFNGFLRTIRPNVDPSELIVKNALRAGFWNFVRAPDNDSAWVKFLMEKMNSEPVDIESMSA
jgi:hypothetical protein